MRMPPANCTGGLCRLKQFSPARLRPRREASPLWLRFAKQPEERRAAVLLLRPLLLRRILSSSLRDSYREQGRAKAKHREPQPQSTYLPPLVKMITRFITTMV